MKVCDFCKNPDNVPVFEVNNIVTKGKARVRRMMNVQMNLCDSCISKYLKAYGSFKYALLNQSKEENLHREALNDEHI